MKLKVSRKHTKPLMVVGGVVALAALAFLMTFDLSPSHTQVAATWLGTQQGIPSYGGYPMPGSCSQGAPDCNLRGGAQAKIGVFSAHKEGVADGATLVTYSTVAPSCQGISGGMWAILGCLWTAATFSPTYPQGGYGSNVTIAKGEGVILEWSCQQSHTEGYAYECGNWWSGSRMCGGSQTWTFASHSNSPNVPTGGALVGSVTVHPTETTTYVLSCVNPGKNVPDMSITVAVGDGPKRSDPLPTQPDACSSAPNACGMRGTGFVVGGSCNATVPPNSECPAPAFGPNGFFAANTTIGRAMATTLTWAAEDATACTLSSDGSFSARSVEPSGSISTGALIQTTTFTLTCENGEGGPKSSRTAKVAIDPNIKEI